MKKASHSQAAQNTKIFYLTGASGAFITSLRENDGFPEFPENGGCRILDALERARIDIKAFPRKEIIEERDENGNVKYWHKCTSFMRNKRTRYE